jgi:hypothetical protein
MIGAGYQIGHLNWSANRRPFAATIASPCRKCIVAFAPPDTVVSAGQTIIRETLSTCPATLVAHRCTHGREPLAGCIYNRKRRSPSKFRSRIAESGRPFNVALARRDPEP